MTGKHRARFEAHFATRLLIATVAIVFAPTGGCSSDDLSAESLGRAGGEGGDGAAGEAGSGDAGSGDAGGSGGAGGDVTTGEAGAGAGGSAEGGVAGVGQGGDGSGGMNQAGESGAPAGGDAGAGGEGDCAGEIPPGEDSPCLGADEEQCLALPAYCYPVFGVRWQVGDPVSQSGKESVYVGCMTGCAAPAYGTCVYHPSDVATCYLVIEAYIPDGWEEIFECIQPPSGYCE